MKLYDHPTAPNPRRVRVFLAEKGIEVERVSVDLQAGEHKTPEFLEKNMNGQIPVLELDDGTCISESIAICRYFEAEHPDPPLFGATSREQGKIEMWIRRIELNFMMPVGLAWVHGSPLTKAVVKQQIPEMAEQARSMVRSYFDFLDQHLEGSEFLAGDAFSVADIIALCTADFAAQLNDLPHSSDQVHLSRWYGAVSGRPSASA